MNILIVEDQDGAAVALKHFLEPLATRIRIAKSMEEAMQIVSDAEELDLITIDLGLPDSPTYSTVDRIKHIKESKPNSLIVVVTGQDLPEIESEVLRVGADGFIYKLSDQFSTTGFLKILAAIVQKHTEGHHEPMQSIRTLQKVSTKLAQLYKDTAK